MKRKLTRTAIGAAACFAMLVFALPADAQPPQRGDRSQMRERMQERGQRSQRGQRGGRSRRQSDPNALVVGEMAPDFLLDSLDGESSTQLSSYRGKKPVILIFGSYT